MSKEEKVLFRSEGTLFELEDPETLSYEPLGDKNTFEIILVKKAPLDYRLVILESEEEAMSQPLRPNSFLRYSLENQSVHWTALVEDTVEGFAFQMFAPEGMTTAQEKVEVFKTLFNQVTYSLYTNTDVVDTSDEWYQYMKDTASQQLPKDTAEEPVYALTPESNGVAKTGRGNVCFADAIQFNLALVLRPGEKENLSIQAHRYNESGFVEDEEGLVVLEVEKARKGFTGALLDPAERNLLLFGGGSSLQHVDLERKAVVQEYEAPEERDILYTTYSYHSSEMNPTLLTCLSKNCAFSIDTRMDPTRCAIYEAGKSARDYALSSLKGTFTCHATSDKGHLAIGDNNGAIRLYSGPPGSRKPDGKYFPKTAKTLLDLKTPVRFLDLTKDGKYLVATCDHFLVILTTDYLRDGEHYNGFVKGMGPDKPTPLKLLPSLQQDQVMGQSQFREAKFDDNEQFIVACYGNYLITWAMKNVIECLENKTVSQSAHTNVESNALSSISRKGDDTVSYLTQEGVGLFKAKKQMSKQDGVRFTKK